MTLNQIVTILALAALTFACTTKPTTENLAFRGPASAKGHGKRQRGRRANTVLIKLKPTATSEEIAELQSVYQELDLKHEKHLFNKRMARVRINSAQFQNQEEDAIERLKATGAVEFAEPDYIVTPDTAPNDPDYGNQWHHVKIGSETAWSYTTGNSAIQVALCDSGFDLTHPDLAPQFVLPGYNTATDNTQINSINGHGTMTAGVIGALGNNNTGVAGVAWNVKVLPIQISNQADGSATISDIVECIRYATDHGAKVVNISYSQLYDSSAINDAASALRTAGGLVVIAAGNDGIDISSAGSSTSLVVVGATDRNDSLAYFSNFGTPVDIFAPGVDIYTTTVGGSYGFGSGTSFAAPIVSGLAGLMYSLNPNLSAAQVESFLVASTNGRVDAGATIQNMAPLFLDNLAAGASDANRTFTGKWCDSTQSGSYGTASLVNCGAKTSSYRFTPTIPKTRAYKVSIRYLAKSSFSQKAPVKIKSASGSTTKQINMQKNGGIWVSLGTYNFNKGTGGFVELSSSNGAVDIDGVLFEPQ